jgi:hypothetical protein
MVENRIRELTYVKASELRANPKNWRKHPEQQRRAMESVLERIGYADALIAREDENGDLILIDGHLRTDISGDDEVPVLILDVNEEEADMILATMDPLANMADPDEYALEVLLKSLGHTDLAPVLAVIGQEFDLDLGFTDLEFDPETDLSDFEMVQYIVQVPRHKADPQLEAAVSRIADQFGVKFKVKGA